MSEVIHAVSDSDTRFILDPITARWSTASEKKTIVQGSHNAERFTFEVPRFIEGHDMSLCNSVQVHYDNIEVKTKNKSGDVYECCDMHLEDEKLVFTWLISKNATKYRGSLEFTVTLKCVADGSLEYEYPTETYDKLRISRRTENGEAVKEAFSDLLSSWKTETLSEVAESIEAAQSAAENAAEAVQMAQELINELTIPWERVSAKPFYSEPFEYVANADTVGEETFEAIGYTWRLTSTDVIPRGAVIGSQIKGSSPEAEGEFVTITEEMMVASMEQGDALIVDNIPLFICREVGHYEGSVNLFGDIIPYSFDITQTGTYSISDVIAAYQEGYTSVWKGEVVKKLDEKYLPFDAIATYIDNYINEALGGDY